MMADWDEPHHELPSRAEVHNLGRTMRDVEKEMLAKIKTLETENARLAAEVANRRKWMNDQLVLNDDVMKMLTGMQADVSRLKEQTATMGQAIQVHENGWKALRDAVDKAITPNDQPHRVIRGGRVIMEGEAAKVFHDHMMLLRRLAEAHITPGEPDAA